MSGFNEVLEELIKSVSDMLNNAQEELEITKQHNKKSISYRSTELKQLKDNTKSVLQSNVDQHAYILALLNSIKQGEGLFKNQIDYLKTVDFMNDFMKSHQKHILLYTPPQHRKTF